MKNDVDSLSYMMGITNTQGLDMYMSQQLGVDTAYMSDFIRGVKEGTSKTSPKDVAIWQVFRLVNKLVDVCSI